MGTLQSQEDLQARLPPRDISNDESPVRSKMYYILPAGPPADTASSDEEQLVTNRALRVSAVSYLPLGQGEGGATRSRSMTLSWRCLIIIIMIIMLVYCNHQ